MVYSIRLGLHRHRYMQYRITNEYDTKDPTVRFTTPISRAGEICNMISNYIGDTVVANNTFIRS